MVKQNVFVLRRRVLQLVARLEDDLITVNQQKSDHPADIRICKIGRRALRRANSSLRPPIRFLRGPRAKVEMMFVGFVQSGRCTFSFRADSRPDERTTVFRARQTEEDEDIRHGGRDRETVALLENNLNNYPADFFIGGC